MNTMKWLVGLFIVVALTQPATCKKIKILSDFTTFQDKEFFKTTFPWIAQNVGPKLRVKYYLKDEKDGGKRMCVLDNLKRNLLLQANYMKCEANGEKDCLKNLPLNQRKLDKCIRKSHKKVRSAEKQFKKYRPSETPMIIRGRSQQTVHDPKTVLFNICGMFGRKQPEGCMKPSEAPVPATPSSTECTQPSTQLPTKPSTDSGTTEKPSEATTERPSEATTSTASGITTSTPSGTTTSTPSATTTSIPSATTTSTPSSTTNSTPSTTTTSTPSGTTNITPSATTTSTPNVITTSTPSGITTSTPSDSTTSTPSGITISTPIDTTTSTPGDTTISTPGDTSTSTPSHTPTSTPSDTPTSSSAPSDPPKIA